MMITIWGRATSSNVQLVMWAIGELGLKYERIDAGGVHGGLNEPAFQQMNPNSRIPVIRDGDLVLWESCAILRYLGARYGDAYFWPTDPALRAPLDMWAEWAKLNFASTFTNGIFWPMVRTSEADRDMALVRTSAGQLATLAPLIDERLGERPYLNGPAFCFADIAVGHILYRYFDVPFERAVTPRLEAYYSRLTERPEFKRHVMVSYESLRAK